MSFICCRAVRFAIARHLRCAAVPYLHLPVPLALPVFPVALHNSDGGGVRTKQPTNRSHRVYDELNLSMFRAYDIRTPSSLLTVELAQRLGSAEAKYFREDLKASTVIVAHDARSTGPHYLALGVQTLLEAGLDVVYLPGVCSTSYFYYVAMRYPDAAAIMFGASHNPAEDTGQKILAPGVIPVAEKIGPYGGLDRIREFYVAGASSRSSDRHSKDRGPIDRGQIRSCELMSDYVDHSMELAGVAPGSLSGIRICADFLCGAAGREMMAAFDCAGADLVPLHFIPDGQFPLGDPNPVKESVIRPGLELLKSGHFQLGFFFDGDGDRIDVYRGDGTYLSSSFAYAAILPAIRRLFSGDDLRVFADLKSNPIAIIEMAKAGVSVDVIRNGHSQIKASLIDSPSHIGAVEESAHFYQSFSLSNQGRYCTENTLFTALLIARVWQDNPSRFEQLIELQQTTAREREWGYKFSSETIQVAALNAVQDHFAKEGMCALDRMKNGMALEGTLMRQGMPFDVNQETQLSDNWIQICQRVSQSETGLARWEVVGANEALVRQAKQSIAQCVRKFGAGEEYKG